ncbi:hypothetical protein GCM10023238_33620 [Streptomyces heliomycini]
MERGEREGRRAVSGAAVAAGVVGALALAALVLRPAEGLLHSGEGPLGHWGFVVIGASLAWAVGAMYATGYLRRRAGADLTGLPPGEERLRQAAVPLLLAGPGVIGVLALVLHRFDHDSTPATPPATPPADLRSQPPPHTAGPRRADVRRGGGERGVRAAAPPARACWPRSSSWSSRRPSYGDCDGTG